MAFLSWLFNRNPKPTRTVQGDCQVFSTDIWRVTLPLNWVQVAGSADTISFETPDKAMGLDVTTIKLNAKAVANSADIATQFQQITRAALARMESYSWTMRQDNQVQTADGNLAILDAHDPKRGYRIYSKAIVQIPFAVRASFHDYGCRNIDESVAYFGQPFESLRISCKAH